MQMYAQVSHSPQAGSRSDVAIVVARFGHQCCWTILLPPSRALHV